MSRSTLLLVCLFGTLVHPAATVAQQHPDNDEARQAIARDKAQVEKKRGISEEGGVKASGPSQGKNGESR